MEMLNEKAAARSLGVSVHYLRRWRWLDKGPVYYRIGGSIRYTELDLDNFIAECRICPKNMDTEHKEDK